MRSRPFCISLTPARCFLRSPAAAGSLFPKAPFARCHGSVVLPSDAVVAATDEAAGVARFVSILAACAPDPLLTSAERKTNLWRQPRDRKRRNRLRVRAAAPASGGRP